ncbi:hypothetical protein B0H12DRAFT_1080907 [Mycena haematopus]|nr:hypothetical protein B0H12DRAFT_1080907 [Mycena haematopus]
MTQASILCLVPVRDTSRFEPWSGEACVVRTSVSSCCEGGFADPILDVPECIQGPGVWKTVLNWGADSDMRIREVDAACRVDAVAVLVPTRNQHCHHIRKDTHVNVRKSALCPINENWAPRDRFNPTLLFAGKGDSSGFTFLRLPLNASLLTAAPLAAPPPPELPERWADYDTNLWHRAILRKALELYHPQDIQAIFEHNPTRLRVAMGTAYTFSQLGKIKSNYMRNGRLIRLETDAPPFEARQRLREYMNVYGAFYKRRGNGYVVRDQFARAWLQAAEQSWHDWITVFIPRPRPAWALEPLPGLQRVRVAAPAAPLHVAAVAPPTAPTTPSTQHISAPVPGSSRAQPIDLSADDAPEAVRSAPKRKFLGVVEVFDDDEEEVEPPMKKPKFLGIVDLTD